MPASVPARRVPNEHVRWVPKKLGELVGQGGPGVASMGNGH